MSWSSRACVVLGAVAVACSAAASGGASPPPWWKNCTELTKRYPHGVGRAGAHDRVKPGNEPVTTFLRSSKLYALAMSHNKGLDRDKDGVACETP